MYSNIPTSVVICIVSHITSLFFLKCLSDFPSSHPEPIGLKTPCKTSPDPPPSVTFPPHHLLCASLLTLVHAHGLCLVICQAWYSFRVTAWCSFCLEWISLKHFKIHLSPYLRAIQSYPLGEVFSKCLLPKRTLLTAHTHNAKVTTVHFYTALFFCREFFIFYVYVCGCLCMCTDVCVCYFFIPPIKIWIPWGCGLC